MNSTLEKLITFTGKLFKLFKKAYIAKAKNLDETRMNLYRYKISQLYYGKQFKSWFNEIKNSQQDLLCYINELKKYKNEQFKKEVHNDDEINLMNAIEEKYHLDKIISASFELQACVKL